MHSPTRWLDLSLTGLAMATALFTTPMSARDAQAAAIVTDLRGDVRLHDGTAAELLRELPVGAKLHVRSDARAVLLHLETQSAYELRGPAVYQIDTRGCATLDGATAARAMPLPPAFRNVRLQPSAITQASTPMRGGNGGRGPFQIFPAATWLLERPEVLRWDLSPRGSSAFSVQLTDAENEVLFEATTHALEVPLPPHLHFAPGSLYAWQVLTVLADGREVEAWTEFGVVDEALRARISQAQPDARADTADRIAFALLLDALNLRDAARRQWQQIAAERPLEGRLRVRAEQR